LRKIFVSDCEGPISKNDNAYELVSHFIPNGNKLFTVMSRYDDVLADVVKRSGYEAGDTLKLILPFLKAYAVTDQQMLDFSSRNLVLISGAKDMLQHVKSIADAFIVSTSYEHYVKALCKVTAFPYGNTYCTKVNLDKYAITENEMARLRELAEEVSKMPIIEIPSKAESVKDLLKRDQTAIARLDMLFWDEIAGMDIGRIYLEVNPVGGSEKARAIRDVVRRVRSALADVMYVGDSITDEEALRLVKENGGLAVSFNGNRYAVENSEVAIMSPNGLVTAVIAEVFCRFGKQQALELVENWSRKALTESGINRALLGNALKIFSRRLPKVKIVTSENMQALVKASSGFRKKVRGEAIGGLG